MKKIILLCLALISCAHAKKELPNLDTIEKCSSSPNCVTSLFPDDKDHYIEPLESFPSAISVIITAVAQMKLELVGKSETSVHAIARSKVFGFIDDIQIQIQENQIHFRSASRSGYYDFGVNRKRVVKLKELIEMQKNP